MSQGVAYNPLVDPKIYSVVELALEVNGIESIIQKSIDFAANGNNNS